MTRRRRTGALPLVLIGLLGGCDEPPNGTTNDIGDASMAAGSQAAVDGVAASSALPITEELALPVELADAIGLDALGILTVTEVANRTTVSAVFVELTEAPGSAAIAAALSSADDRCDELNVDSTLSTLPAGEAIVLSASSGTWATLERVVDANFISYASASETGQAPERLQIDIPGAAFPAMRIAVPAPPTTLELIDVRIGEPLPADTHVSWIPSEPEDLGAQVQLIIAVGQIRFLCRFNDDGDGQPALSLNTNEQTLTLLSASRIGHRTVTRDRATLIVERRTSTQTAARAGP